MRAQFNALFAWFAAMVTLKWPVCSADIQGTPPEFYSTQKAAMMFAPTHADTRHAAGLYQAVQVDTGVASATPHQLVALLFEGFVSACAQARGAIQSANVQAKCLAIGRAVRIVEEGLRAGLNLDAGGALARDLHDLYTYVVLRLTHANLHNDEVAIAECQRLIAPVQEAWGAIAPPTDAPRQPGGMRP